MIGYYDPNYPQNHEPVGQMYTLKKQLPWLSYQEAKFQDAWIRQQEAYTVHDMTGWLGIPRPEPSRTINVVTFAGGLKLFHEAMEKEMNEYWDNLKRTNPTSWYKFELELKKAWKEMIR